MTVGRLLTLLMLAHLVGLAWALGAASVKLALLLRCRTDRSFIQAYVKVVGPITRQLVAGMIVLTASGIGWLLLGQQLTSILVVKLMLVAAIWVAGAGHSSGSSFYPGTGIKLKQQL